MKKSKQKRCCKHPVTEDDVNSAIKTFQECVKTFKETQPDDGERQFISSIKEKKEYKPINYIPLIIMMAVIVGFGFLVFLAKENYVSEIESRIYEYEIKIIELNNTNYVSRENVIDYICTDGVEVTHYQKSDWLSDINWFYASTWIDAIIDEGSCAIKIKRRKQ